MVHGLKWLCFPPKWATSHTRLKSHDRCILRSLIGRKGRDHSSSLQTTRCEAQGPRAIIVDEMSIWVQAYYKIMFYGMLKFATGCMQIMADCINGTAFGMRIKGPHNYMIMAVGSCVKWPLVHYQIQTKGITTFLVIFGAHMNVLLTIKVHILVLIKWPYRLPAPNHQWC